VWSGHINPQVRHLFTEGAPGPAPLSYYSNPVTVTGILVTDGSAVTSDRHLTHSHPCRTKYNSSHHIIYNINLILLDMAVQLLLHWSVYTTTCNNASSWHSCCQNSLHAADNADTVPNSCWPSDSAEWLGPWVLLWTATILTHHHHWLLLSLKTETHFTIPQHTEQCIHLLDTVYHCIMAPFLNADWSTRLKR